MHVVLAAVLFFGILTLWVPAYWPVSVFQVGIFSLAVLAIWRERNGPHRFCFPFLALILAVAWAVFQWMAGLTAYTFETQRAAVHWATFLAVFLIGFHLFQDDGARRWFRSAMLWFGFAIALLATVQTFTSGGKIFWLFPTPYTDLVMGPILYQNHYAAFIELILPVALYKALSSEKDSLLYSGMACAIYASVIASASRAGTSLTTVEILTVSALMWGRRRATGHAIGLTLLQMAVFLGVFTAVVGYEHVWNRLWLPDPMAFRREVANSTLHMIAAQPWFGVGLGVWPNVYPRYAIVDFGVFVNQAHNDWLQWTAEGGIPFGLLIATLFFWCLRPAFRSVWGLGVVAVFLHAIVDYPFSRPALGSWTFVVVAMLAARESDSYRGVPG